MSAEGLWLVKWDVREVTAMKGRWLAFAGICIQEIAMSALASVFPPFIAFLLGVPWLLSSCLIRTHFGQL